ncbi:MAG: hypothetical protein WCA56_16620 [Xanthobacteraceae bacterium]|jgi:hypothetical protein
MRVEMGYNIQTRPQWRSLRRFKATAALIWCASGKLAIKMTTPLGVLLYRAATIVALAIVFWDAANFVYGLSQGEPIIRVAGLLLAGAIWLIGLCCRFMLTDR